MLDVFGATQMNTDFAFSMISEEFIYPLLLSLCIWKLEVLGPDSGHNGSLGFGEGQATNLASNPMKARYASSGWKMCR